jgi:hypothetical protein
MVAVALTEIPPKAKGISTWKKMKYLVRLLSAGKYTTNLYNNSKSQHASVCGGVTTVILTSFILINVYFIFSEIFGKS